MSKKTIVSVHIPKTAGSEFRRILELNYGSESIYFDYQSMPCHNDFEVETLEDFSHLNDNIKVIHGHFVAKRYQNLDSSLYISWLRNPLERLISHYYFFLNIPNIENNKYLILLQEKKLSFLEFCELPVCQNFQSKFLEGINIDQYCFLGITENFEEDINKLGNLLNWQYFDINKTNVNPTKNYQDLVKKIKDDQNLCKKIKELNQEDFDLYYRIKNNRCLHKRKRKITFWQKLFN